LCCMGTGRGRAAVSAAGELRAAAWNVVLRAHPALVARSGCGEPRWCRRTRGIRLPADPLGADGRGGLARRGVGCCDPASEVPRHPLISGSGLVLRLPWRRRVPCWRRAEAIGARATLRETLETRDYHWRQTDAEHA